MHIQESRTIDDLAAKYGICHDTVSNQIVPTVKSAKQMMPQSPKIN